MIRPIPLLAKSCLLFCLVCCHISFASVAVQALKITQDNAVELIQSGPDAIGGIGDWFFTNGTLCAVISATEHENEFSMRGGTLIDLGFCDRADDHFTTAQDLLDGKQTRSMTIEHVETQLGDDWASITTLGRREGATIKTRYTLSEQTPTQLQISKQLTRDKTDSPNFNFYTPLWFNYHSLETFVYSSKNLANSSGFKNIDFISRGASAMTDATRRADTVILISPPDAEQAIAYGWQLKSAQRVSQNGSYDVPSFILSDEESTALFVLVDSFYIGDGSNIGLLQLPQIPFLSLHKDESLELEEVIYVGKRADVSSITDQILVDAGDSIATIQGRLKEINSALHVDLVDGTPVTFIRPEHDGSFQFTIKQGDYLLRHVGTANRVVEHKIQVHSLEHDLGPMTLSEPAKLNLPQGQAMRLVFVGLGDTNPPHFEDHLTAYSIADDDGIHMAEPVSQIFLAGIDSDQKQVDLPPGSYRIYATRGPEYSLGVTEVKLQAGKTSDLIIEIPKQTVFTPGFIAADLHVHSGVSFDNTFSTSARVKTFVAEHGEVMVSSDHDRAMDFAPIIQQMGVTENITSIAAIEMTSLLATKTNPFTGGHVNFFPVQPEPLEYRKGTLNHEGRRVRDWLHDMRHKYPNVIAQLNHARLTLELSGDIPDNYADLIHNGEYLDHMGVAGYPYNPNKTLDTPPNNSLIEKDPDTGVRDIDFDAMEIINGSAEHHHERVRALQKDWLSFLKQGVLMTGTANSDSHHSTEQVANPRTMVAVSEDTIATFDQNEFLTALRSGNAYGTTGPMLEVSLQGTHMGQTFRGKKGVLKLKIMSADWIPVDTVLIHVNGITMVELKAKQTREFNTELIFSKDSFVTIEISGPATQAYSQVYRGMTPYAFSNPIYVDFDADGNWQAPGL